MATRTLKKIKLPVVLHCAVLVGQSVNEHPYYNRQLHHQVTKPINHKQHYAKYC